MEKMTRRSKIGSSSGVTPICRWLVTFPQKH